MDFTGLQNYWGHTLDGYGYTMDNLALRTNVTRNFGLTTNSVSIGYDNIGQLTSWIGKEASGSLRFNEDLGFGFDAAGNLLNRTNGGLFQSFTVDSANQLTNINRTGTLTLNGSLPAPALGVSVNGLPAQTNSDFTFAQTNMTLTNGQNTFVILATNAYGVKATNNFSLNSPINTALQYDANGNLTNDGAMSLIFDAENRLTNVNVAGQWKVEFVFDGLGRRRLERDYFWLSGNWLRTNETRLLYDGSLPIQERDSNNAVQLTLVRGLDLSGSLGRAGGIGGLLARMDATNAVLFYHADGIGNVTALMDGNQNVVGRYLYDPFGRELGQWGPMANVNEMQFSSMPVQRQSGLVLYAFRDGYDPRIQRWIQRDPIGEAGGINLYGFVGNSPLNAVDPQGLDALGTLSAAINRVQDPLGLGQLADNARQWLSQNASLVGQGLYDYAMGDNLGKYDQNTKGALDAQLGLVDIDAHNNILRDSAGLAAAAIATIAEGAAEQYVAGKALEGTGGNCPTGPPPPAETTDLYRAVGVREFNDVMANQAFKAGGNSLEARQFATTLEEALKYADTDPTKVAILKATVPTDILSKLEFSKSIDPHIFKNGVFTVQPEVQPLFNQSIQSIKHAY